MAATLKQDGYYIQGPGDFEKDKIKLLIGLSKFGVSVAITYWLLIFKSFIILSQPLASHNILFFLLQS